MPISLEHHVLKADLEASAKTLGVTIEREEARRSADNGRVVKTRTYRVRLPRPAQLNARFVREGLLERAKKMFVHEVECGHAWFDDLIYVVTDTKEQTAKLLEAKRVQQALVMLVDGTRSVEIDPTEIRVIDNDAPDNGRDAQAELLALTAHVLGLV